MTLPAAAQDGTDRLVVHADRPGIAISHRLYGLMTEEINHSYDGGIYAELIRNRAFKDSRIEPVNWVSAEQGGATARLSLETGQPIKEALTTCLKVEVAGNGAGHAGAANSGFWGVPVLPRTTYHASFWAKAAPGFHGSLTAAIESTEGETIFAAARTGSIGTSWRQYSLTLTTGNLPAAGKGRFAITTSGKGAFYLNEVSLFPPTYHHRANGNRIDLMEKLAAMHPAFLRLPGGNYLEGDTIPERFDWKKTLGPISDRPGHQCPWGYRSSDGMGLLEFLEWCEDLRMQPVLAVYAGYSLRGDHVQPGPGLGPYVQDALDEIEYATGDEDTTWGARRAEDGHPAPFHIEYVEIGNEDMFDRSGSYDARFTQFFDAIRAHYPALKQIATARVTSRVPDLIDDHYYVSAREMESRLAHRYDNYPRKGPKVFVGEWASIEGSPTPTMNAALGDAAFLTGLERNSDVVPISSYAPLLVNVNPRASQWGTNLIGYDAVSSFGSPSYYVQQMFSTNLGDVLLPVDIEMQSAPHEEVVAPKGAVGVGTWATRAEYKDLTVSHDGSVLYQSGDSTALSGFRRGAGQWAVRNGVITQSSGATDCRLVTGDPSWADYTYTLKARKTGGDEGFLILFHVRNRADYLWWNIGGWGNTRTALERSAGGSKEQIGPESPVTVETGRWYDVKIEVHGENIQCYLDGKLITEAHDAPPPPPPALFAIASRVRSSREVILKVVNTSGSSRRVAIDLQGIRSVARAGRAIVLSGRPEEVNTVEHPTNIAPKTETIEVGGPSFTHEFPAYSVTVLRVRAQ
jgi:alpha-L-arabinofuranosidase